MVKCPKTSYTKPSDKIAYAISEDPDLEGAVWSRSTLFAILLSILKQEDHDGPISLTWANRFAYLLVKFQPSLLL